DPNELVHNADLAVYRAKLQGRNRVLGSNSSETLLIQAPPQRPLVAPMPKPAPLPVVEPPPAQRLPAEVAPGVPSVRSRAPLSPIRSAAPASCAQPPTRSSPRTRPSSWPTSS